MIFQRQDVIQSDKHITHTLTRVMQGEEAVTLEGVYAKKIHCFLTKNRLRLHCFYLFIDLFLVYLFFIVFLLFTLL